MRILFIGDPHLKMSRFQQGMELLRWIEAVVKKERPDLVVNLGDTFNDFSVLRAELLAEFREHVINITYKLGVKYLYLLGNHDLYKPNDSKYHALQGLQDIENLTIVRSPVEFGGITYVPYLPNPQEFPKKTSNICVAHQTFRGADYGFIITEDGVNADEVSADIIISGHIHKRQQFGNVLYPGTPCAYGVDDANQSKGLLIFDTDTYKQTYIDSPFPKWHSLDYEINGNLTVKDTQVSLISQLNDNDFFQVKLTGNRADLLSFLDSNEIISLRGKYKINFKTIYIDKEKKKAVLSAKTAIEAIKEYIDKVYIGEIDKLKLEKRALDLLKSTAIKR